MKNTKKNNKIVKCLSHAPFNAPASARIFLLILFVTFISINNSFAQPYSSNSAGSFATAGNWTPSGPPDLTFWDGSHDATVNHDMTSGALTLTNNNLLTITSGNTLTITGNLTLGNNGKISIDNGATLIVNGSIISNSSGANLNNYGTLTISNNFSLSTSTVQHNLGGTVTIGGAFTATGSTNVNITGDLDITGDWTVSGNTTATSSSDIAVGGKFTLSGSGTNLTMNGGSLDVTGLVDQDSDADLTVNSATVDIGGNYNMDGANTDLKINGGVVTIAGTLSVQSDSKVTGTDGKLLWGGFDIYCAGSGFLKCDGTIYGNSAEGCANEAHASGMDFSGSGTCSEPCPVGVTAGADDEICPGGTASLTASGATSYSWCCSLGTGTGPKTPSPASTTTYTVTFDGIPSCTDEAKVTVLSAPTATAPNVNVCSGTNTSLNGGGGGTYSWSPGTYLSSTTAEDPTVTNPLATTTYTVTVTAANTCTDTEDLILTVYSLPTATASSNSPVYTESTLSLTGGGAGGGSYAWEGPLSYSSSTQSPTVSSNATTGMAGTYTVTVTDGNSCTDTEKTTVTIYSNAENVCSGGTPPATSEVSGPSGGSGSYNYQWQNSTDGTNYSNISGATSSTYNPTSITQATWYRRAVTSGSCIEYSNVLKASIGNVGNSIGDDLLVWLKADAGTGSIGTQWDDQSGNDYHYSTSSGPVLSSGNFVSNYNPSVKITSGGFEAHADAKLGDVWSCFFVAKKLSTDNDGVLFEGDNSAYVWGYSGTYMNSININSSPAEYQSGIAEATDTNFHIFSYIRNSSDQIEARRDGVSLKTFTSTNSGSGQRIHINNGVSGDQSDSRVCEMVIYNSTLASTEVNQMESYLSMKYGIRLDEGGSNGNYITMDGGSVVWDASANSSYNNDIVSIGSDCGYLQKQSATDDDSLFIFLSTLAATNAANTGTIANTESYVMIGHNGNIQQYTAASNAEAPSGITGRLAREWRIENSNFTDTYSIKFEVTESFTAADTSKLRLLVDDDGDFSDATIINSTVNFTIGSVTVDDIDASDVPDGESYVTLGEVDETLPIELYSFKASCLDNENITFEWITLTETNNDYFTIEYSTDGRSFKEIDNYPGAGNSNMAMEYSADVYYNGITPVFFRLKQTDYDGKFSHSGVIAVNRCERDNKLSIFNNGTTDGEDIALNMFVKDNAVLEILLYDYSGRVIQQYNYKNLMEGQYTFPLRSLPSGAYLIKVVMPYETFTEQVIVR